MIEVIDYHKTYHDTVAVAGLSFAVRAGEVLGLLGPNPDISSDFMRSAIARRPCLL